MGITCIQVNCLRPDHTMPYEYHRNLTPNLRKVAGRAWGSDRPLMAKLEEMGVA